MKAILLRNYGDTSNLKIEEVQTPTPQKDEILVKIQYFSISPLEIKIRKGEAKLFVKKKLPMIMGSDFGGEIIEIGEAVGILSVGDYVIGSVDPFKDNGPYAEFICVKPERVIKKPIGLDAEMASLCPVSGMSALQVLRDLGKLQAGQQIMILGGSGSLGHLAIQLAKKMDAHVTAVSSRKNFPFLKSLGTDEVIDYQKETVFSKDKKYHVIFDAVNKYRFNEAKKALNEGGIYINSVPSPALLFQSLFNPFRNKKIKLLNMKFDIVDLEYVVSELSKANLKLHIEKIYGGLEAIRSATEHIESERVVGKIGIKIW